MGKAEVSKRLAFCLSLAAAPAALAGPVPCKGNVEVLGNTVRLVEWSPADVSIKHRYTIDEGDLGKTIVVSANGTIHHTANGETHTTSYQPSWQHRAGEPAAMEDTKRVDVRWCSPKTPCTIDKIELTNISCAQFRE